MPWTCLNASTVSSQFFFKARQESVGIKYSKYSVFFSQFLADFYHSFDYITIFILVIWVFFTPAEADGFLLESDLHQVFWTLLSIRANLNNAIVWMILLRLVISMSSSSCTNPLVSVPTAPIISDVTVILMFNRLFFTSLAMSRCYLLFRPLLVLPCGRPER